MKDSRNTKGEEMKRQTQREESTTERGRGGEGEKEHFGGFSGGEIIQMSLKASMTVVSLCILGNRQIDRETDGHRGSSGCSGNVRFQNRTN